MHSSDYLTTIPSDESAESIVGLIAYLEDFNTIPSQSNFVSCGDPVFFDGFFYETVEIGGQCWFKENLRTLHYRNGDEIPSDLNATSWWATNNGATTTYGEMSIPCETQSPNLDACNSELSFQEYGRLYNGFSILDSRGLCPTEWHVPALGEFEILTDYLPNVGLYLGQEGYALKSETGWTDGGNGADAFGFTGLPGGAISTNNGGSYHGAGFFGTWWSSTISTNGSSLGWWQLRSDMSTDFWTAGGVPSHGLSVRCVHDDVLGCMNPDFLEFSSYATIDNGTCATPVVLGCTWDWFLEYNPAANMSDGSCETPIYMGCTDSNYLEYQEEANTDDGSCLTYLDPTCGMLADGNNDGIVNSFDLLGMLSEFGTSIANVPFASCGDPLHYQGRYYETVEIGGQCWFAENLMSTQFANGEAIPQGTADDWQSLTSARLTWYGRDMENSECEEEAPGFSPCNSGPNSNYGNLYNWLAVDDDRGLCPTGWHVPSDFEWMALESHLNMPGSHLGYESCDRGVNSDFLTSPLKTNYGWKWSNHGSNSTGFSALPSGLYNPVANSYTEAGYRSHYWTSTNSIARAISTQHDRLCRYSAYQGYGMSVRCVQD